MQPVYNNVYQQPDNTIFIDLLNHEDFLVKYEHFLKGEISVLEGEGKNQRYVWKRRYPPKMNDQGVNSVIVFLRAVCEKMLAITDLSEEQIDILALQNIQDFHQGLVSNIYNYGFANYDSPEDINISDLNWVEDTGRMLILAQLRRSVDGMTLRAISSHTSIQENRNMNPQDTENQGIGSRLPVVGGIRNLFKL